MFWSWTGYAFRAVAAILGGIAVYLASLTYEDEEERFQNKLEDWWLMLDEKRSVSLSWAVSSTRAIAELTGNWLDRLFGKRLLSPRSVVVSVILSGASLFLTASVLLAFPIASVQKIPNTPTAFSAFALFFHLSAFAMLPALSDSPNMPWKPWLPRSLRFYWWVMIAWFSLQTAPFLLYVLSYSPKGQTTGVQLISMAAICLGASLLSDVAYIAFTRWTLRRISKTNRIAGIVLGIILQVTFLAVLLVWPIYAGLKLTPFSAVLGASIFFSCMLNSIDVFATFAALIVAVLMLVHRMAWPLIQRPLYAIQRTSHITRKGWLWSVGIALLTFSVTGFPGWMKALFERSGH